MRVVLRIQIAGQEFDQAINVGTYMTFGRSSEAQCQINNDRISSLHCKFYFQRDSLQISDLNSKNGTYLNGIRIEKSELFLGDEIKIGDATLTIAEDKMDEESKKALTFPGKHKERMNYELKVDFSGARIQNQIFDHATLDKKENQTPAHAKEIAIRARLDGLFRISKEEIKQRYELKSNLAAAIDFVILIILGFLPILGQDYWIQMSFSGNTPLDPTMLLISAELATLSFFSFLNFKVSKFSVGEKMVGLEKIYLDQQK